MASDRSRRGLLIDYGGVLTTDVFASFSAFCEFEGLAPDAIGQVFREHPDCREMMLGFESGTVVQEQFESQVAGLLGVEPAGLIDRLFGGTKLDELMLETVRRVRAGGTRTGLLSNSWGTTHYPRDLLAELFDAVVISGEVGMRKPSPEIYVLGAERLGLAPADCVFVDDLSSNLDPAAELGMATVHHRVPEETIAQLERLLGMSLR